MRDCNAVKSFKGLKWDIRPRPDFGTIEFRICDTPSSMSDVFALAAMIRSLVINGKRLLEDRPRAQRGDRRREWITAENRWLAARYGLDAVYIRTPAGKRGQLQQEVSELLKRLQPIARESGDDVFLRGLEPLDKFESGAQRQRRLYRAGGDWRLLIQDAVQRLEQELKLMPAAA
jgi:carboxylate-amine ligase